jgi:hypothetical protein
MMQSADYHDHNGQHDVVTAGTPPRTSSVGGASRSVMMDIGKKLKDIGYGGVVSVPDEVLAEDIAVLYYSKVPEDPASCVIERNVVIVPDMGQEGQSPNKGLKDLITMAERHGGVDQSFTCQVKSLGRLRHAARGREVFRRQEAKE